MKKQANRLIALVISLVMLLSMVPVGHIHAQAEEVTDQTETPVETTIQAAEEEVLSHCICGGAAAGAVGHICDETVTWKPWANGETHNDGAYYLTEDVVLSATVGLAGTLSVDLNGHDLTISTSGTKQIFSVAAGGTLNICDSVGGGSVTATSVATGSSGTIVNANVGGATVNIFGGTFDASGIQGSTQQGVAFNIVGSTLNLYGGTVIGTDTTNHGGAVYVNIYGNNTANATAGFFNMYGGEIYGGTSGQGSGNLFVGGNAGKDADGNAVTGSVKLLGGTIYGSAVTTGKTVSVGGSVKILETQKDGTAANCGLWVKDGNTATVLALNSDACIYLDKNTNTNAAVFGEGVTAQAYGQIRVGQHAVATLSLDAENTAYVLSGSALKLGTGRYSCLCGQEAHIGDCHGEVLVWLPWTQTNSLPAGSGNYYLTAEVVSTATTPRTVTANKTMNLDLNGFAATNAITNFYNLTNGGETLNITDSVGGGSITATGKNVVNIGAANAAFSLYGGTLQSTVSTINANGGNNKNACSVNIHGGTVIGGSTSFGGAVYINNGASLHMTGGTVYGGTATSNGDNIFVGGSAADSYITGGTVYGGPNYNAITTTGSMLYIGGSVKVHDYLNDEAHTAANGIYTTAPTKIRVLPLNADAEIRFKGAAGAAVAYLDSTIENKNYAQLLGNGSELVALPDASGKLVLTAGKLHCLCAQSEHIGDCTGEVLLWTPWSATALPTATGNYYLTADITDGGQALPEAGAVINLDLNGKSFAPKQNASSATGNYFRAYVLEKEGIVLNITDSVGGGVIYGGVRGDSGLVIRLTKASTLNLYAGTLDGSTSVETSSSEVKGAVQLNTDSNATFNMYGGKVIGVSKTPTHFANGTATETVVSVIGSAVYANANTSLNQLGGEIDGDVYIQLEIAWVIDGETVETYVEKGTVPTMTKPVKDGYTFVGWSLKENGAVLETLPAATANATYYAVFAKSGATVTWTNWDGTVLEVDENVAIGETPTYDGTEPARAADSEHVYVFKGWDPEVSAVTGNVTYKATFQWLNTVAQVGETYYSSLDTAFNAANGGTVILLSNVSLSKTMGIAAEKDITIDLNGHVISASNSLPATSSMFSVAGKLTIRDSVSTGAIDASNATASTVGGLAILANNATGHVVLESGTVIGGTTSNFGGAIYINAGAKFTMTGGELIGGKAADANDANKGDSLFVGGNANIVVELLGGTVYGGIRANGSTVRVGASAKILETLKNGEPASYGLLLSESNTVTVLKLNGDACIYLDKLTAIGNAIALFGEGVEAENYPQLKLGAYTAENLMKGKDAVIMEQSGKLYAKEGRYSCLCGQPEHIGDCDGTLLLWKPLSGNTLPGATGNYYLTADIETAGQANVNANAIVNLDLNGHTVTMAPNPGAAVEGGTYNYWRAFALNNDGAVLNITDSVGSGAIRGGVRGMGGTVINIKSASTVNLYGGTLDGTLQTETTSDQNIQGAVAVLDGAVLNVYGGSILGVDKKVQKFDQATNTAIENAYAVVSGSAVYVANGGSFSISGGSVVGGMAGNGGAVYNSGSVTVSGGQILGGTAVNGGAVYSAGIIEMTGGKIVGGTADEFGGAVYLNNGAVMTVTGGVISGGSAVQKGNTLFVGGNANGSVQLLGGTVYGGVWTTGNTVSVGGSVNILQTLENGEAAAYGLKVEASNTVTVLALNDDAVIYLDKTAYQNNPVAVFGAGVEAKKYDQLLAGAASVDALLKGVEGSDVHLIDGQLFLTAGQWDCLCRHDEHIGDCTGEKNIFWRAWTDTTKLPSNGSYYLTADIENGAQTAVSGILNLDLNGHSVRVGKNPASDIGNNYRVLYMSSDNSALNITDSVGGGKLFAGQRHDAGHIVYILDCDATFNLYAGVLTAEETVDTNGKRGQLSGLVYSTKAGTFNMYGGEIIGWNGLEHADTDRLAEDGYAFVSGTGASVTFAGTFNMYDGIIRGGNAIPGNTGSTGDGGNVFMMEGSTFNMYGGSITGGTAQYGGNVYICAGATYNYEGGTIENGTALIYGDEVFCVEDSELLYTVTFQDENGEALWSKQLYRGAQPDFDGVVTKKAEGVITYTHIGWNPGVRVVTEDVVYTPVFEETVHEFLVDQWNLTLGDDLDVNFHVNIREDLVETAYMQITVGNGKPVSYPISEAAQTENGAYIFVAEVAAAQMADTITLQIINGEVMGESCTYSVEQYAEYVLANESMESYHAIVKEMLNYGAKAQAYFGYNTENLVGADADLTGTAAKDISGDEVKDMIISGNAENIAFYGASLVFRSKIAVRFYFTGDISGYTFDIGTVGQKDGLYYLEIADIDPQDLDEAITVTVGGLSVTYSPMNYMVRKNATGSDELKSLLKALYNYHLAAEALTAA